jgi:hypothetical protein
MTPVFVGGSRRIARVSPGVAIRLDNIIKNRLPVLIGDAPGFDRAAQEHFATRGYELVTVYCTSGEARNNVGNWPLACVEYHGKGRGLEFYTAKDDAMLRDATYGLFAWDGKSKGTLRNIQLMAEASKPSVVSIAPANLFVTLRSAADVAALFATITSDSTRASDLFSESWRASA